MEQEIYSVNEFLSKFCLGRTTFYALVAKGEIPTLLRGRRRLIARSDAEVWINSLRDNKNEVRRP